MTGFPAASGVPNAATLTFTDADLAWSLFVTGRAPGDEALHGFMSVWEFVHRVSLVPAYVRVAPTGWLMRSTLALELDRSEKVNLSYSLGQAMAGILADQLLGSTRLMHVDRYAVHHHVAFAPGKNRPDLFGEGTGGWVVIEAKGRSNATEAALTAKLKAQKSMVADINGSTPWVAAGVVSEFPLPSRVLHLRAIDPPASNRAQSWEVDPDLFAAAYYEPFLTALALGTAASDIPDDDVVVVDLGAIGVRVGLLRSIVDLVAESRANRYEGLAARIATALGAAGGHQTRRDGSLFTTTWADALNRTDVEG
jgi:hypothetical protein